MAGERLRLGLAGDHAGFALKGAMRKRLQELGFEPVDFGAHAWVPDDDYPDFVIPLARAVASGELDRGIAICGSGVGAAVAANKVRGVRACLINDPYSAHQGVEHDDLNVLCLGARVIGEALAWDLTRLFLEARFEGGERHRRRLARVAQLENDAAPPPTPVLNSV